MKKSELFALNEWLSEWPKNATFDDVLYLLLDNNDQTVIPWDAIEDHPRVSVAQFISSTQTHFAAVTNER